MRSLLLIAQLAILGSAVSAQGLAAVGPISPDHGFPEWYEDSNGVRIAPCLTDLGLCALEAPVTLIDPTLPFPDNYGGVFADHAFYNVCEAEMTSANGGLALLVISLQGGFANDLEAAIPGDQDVFARFRVRVDNLIQGETYVVTTPVGVFSFIAESSGRRGINFTDDVGRLEPGVFGTELGGAIGPWLMWDSELPILDAEGRSYVGDPAVPHTITGSPFGTNIFRIEGPSVGGPGINMIETDLFSVIGLLSDDVVDPPPPPPAPEFTLAIDPGTAGALNTLTASDGTEGGLVAFTFGFNPGERTIAPAPCPGGIVLGLRDPRLIGFGTTTGGSASFDLQIPPGLAGLTVNMQAIDVAACQASNLISPVL